jgi:hypothetical protein
LVNSQTVRTDAGRATFAAIPICRKLSPHVLFQRTAVHVKLVLAILKEGAANGFLQPADALSHLTNALFIACQSAACETADNAS